MQISINKEIMKIELTKLIRNILILREIDSVRIRDIIMKKDSIVSKKISQAIERSYHDCYSDVDMYIVVKINPRDTMTPLEYMKRIDRFGLSKEDCLGLIFDKENNVCRIVLKNGMRYDISFIFEYDDTADIIEIEPKEKEYSNSNYPLEKVNHFWFVQVQALGKLYRRDYLISDHLANINLNETLVQQMVLRDMKYGTNHHRYGDEEEPAYLQNEGKCFIKTKNEIFNRIADKLYCAAVTYDELTVLFYLEHEKRSDNFFRIWKCYEENRLSEIDTIEGKPEDR